MKILRLKKEHRLKITLLVVVLVTLLFYNLTVSSKTISMAKDSSTKYILYYTPFFGSKDWNMGVGREPFLASKCPSNNCYLTTDPNLLPDVNQFDGVLFHVWETHKLPDPKTRLPHQRYVMFTEETPQTTDFFPFKDYGGVFNATMSYRLDSTIYRPYGFVEPIAGGSRQPVRGLKSSPLPSMRHKAENLIVPSTAKAPGWIREALLKKKRGVAWIVSHCRTSSQREDYVEELRRHIEVDVYGNCGQLSCTRRRGADCFREVETNYKFYLAFENSMCRDYVTEKFWNTLNSTMVPVVLGDGHEKVAPKGSYIDASQYSPKKLADLLKELSRPDRVDKLLGYHSWKSVFRVYSTPRDLSACNICAYLNSGPQSNIYQDLNWWWVEKAKCQSRGSYSWSMPEAFLRNAKNIAKDLRSKIW